MKRLAERREASVASDARIRAKRQRFDLGAGEAGNACRVRYCAEASMFSAAGVDLAAAAALRQAASNANCHPHPAAS